MIARGQAVAPGYDRPMPDRLHFTESDEANELIASDPMALLIGFALDQQVTVQKAFSGPLALTVPVAIAPGGEAGGSVVIGALWLWLAARRIR